MVSFTSCVKRRLTRSRATAACVCASASGWPAGTPPRRPWPRGIRASCPSTGRLPSWRRCGKGTSMPRCAGNWRRGNSWRWSGRPGAGRGCSASPSSPPAGASPSSSPRWRHRRRGTLEDQVRLVRYGRSLLEELGWPDRVGVLAGGRSEDRGRSPRWTAPCGGPPPWPTRTGARLRHILIEEAVEEDTFVLAPDGRTGQPHLPHPGAPGERAGRTEPSIIPGSR